LIRFERRRQVHFPPLILLLIFSAQLLHFSDEQLTSLTGSFGYVTREVIKNTGHGKPVDIWSTGTGTPYPIEIKPNPLLDISPLSIRSIVLPRRLYATLGLIPPPTRHPYPQTKLES